jgi:8-oxo-dGTP pyrophosphatase MutT (NUDIX family)
MSGIPEKVGKEFANADPGGKLPTRAKDLGTEKFGTIKKALKFMSEFFSEEEKESEHEGQDEAPKGRAASVAFVCPDGRTLFVKRADDENDPHSGKWCWPGGQAEDEEDFADCARREAIEEAGKDCNFDGMAELHKMRTEHGWDHATYVVPVKEPFEPQLSDEHADHRWAHVDEMPEPLHPGCKATIDEVLKPKPENPEPAKLRIKPIVATRDETERTREHEEGKLPNETKEHIGTVGSEQRESLSEADFLLPEQKKYPVKKDGKYDRQLLLAAAREARMHGRTDLARRADAIRAKEFGSEEDAHDEIKHDPKNGQFTSGSGATYKLHQPYPERDFHELHHETQGVVGSLGHQMGPQSYTAHYGDPKRSKEVTTLSHAPRSPSGANVHTRAMSGLLGRGGYARPKVFKNKKGAAIALIEHHETQPKGAKDTPLVATKGGWLRQNINAGSEMPAFLKSQRIEAGQLKPGKVVNVAKDAQLSDWSKFRAKSKGERVRIAMDRALGAVSLAADRRAGTQGWAFDRASDRQYDSEGRMHVKDSNLTKANVCPYFGKEIPDYDKLGLDPERKYMLLRDPKELEKAVKTANGRPVLDKHEASTAADHPKELTVGATGTNARWADPYIKNDLSIWPNYASQAIEDGSQRELSAGYSYKPDMTPGTYQGVPYDGVMRDIAFNHFALVVEGRAGKDVAVADAMPSAWSRR